MRFKDIEGQTVMANYLTEVIDGGRIGHAQMLLGGTADGSLALAIAYAQYLNCGHRVHYGATGDGHWDGPQGLRADSCGECPSCKKYEQLVHSDLHLFFPTSTSDLVKSNPVSNDYGGMFREFLAATGQRGTLDDWYAFMGVDNKQGMIRERDADALVQVVGMTTYEDAWKVIVVWMAEKMNATFANKVLKVLEEPTPKTLIMMVVENTERMLSTIVSRTQITRVPRSVGSSEAKHGEVQVRAENEAEFAQLFVVWMRQLFKLNMVSLSQWVEQLASRGREQQKQFLQYAHEALRECFLRHNAGVPLSFDFGDEKFNASFPSMLTERNIEAMDKAMSEALYAIERNAYTKIVLMELSFRISKALKKR